MYGHERSLVKDMQNRPFALIGVNSDSDLAKIRNIVKEKDLTWRSFQNSPAESTSSISTTWSVSGWPTLIILDAEMKIRYRGHNGNTAIDLAKRLVSELEKNGDK